MNVQKALGAGVACLSIATACGGEVNISHRGAVDESGGAYTGTGGTHTGSGGFYQGTGGVYGGSGFGAVGGYGAGGWYTGAGGIYFAGGAPAGGMAGIPGCAAPLPQDPGQDVPEGGPCGQTPNGPTGTCQTSGEASIHPLHKILGHAECAGSLICVPNLPIADGGIAVSATCATTMGLGGLLREGRCLPRVAAAGWALARDLTTESCAADTVCIPCTGPIHEEFTGVCNPLENPHGIKPCGAWDGGPSGGYCVAQEKVDAWGLPMSPILRQDECIAGEKCVPAAQVEAPRSCSARCTTTLGSFGDQYAPGACVPTYIVRDVNPTGLAILTQGTCAFGEMCAPCLDPLNNGVSSRMCE